MLPDTYHDHKECNPGTIMKPFSSNYQTCKQSPIWRLAAAGDRWGPRNPNDL